MWPYHEIVRLIEEYKNTPVLWNENCVGYKNKQLRLCAYEAIANKLNLDVFKMRKKIKNLRTCFFRERKKFKSLQDTGCHLEMYRKWHFYDMMAFIEESETPAMFDGEEDDGEVGHDDDQNEDTVVAWSVSEDGLGLTNNDSKENMEFSEYSELLQTDFLVDEEGQLLADENCSPTDNRLSEVWRYEHNKVEWLMKDIRSLIFEYKKMPILWDPNHEDFKSNAARQLALSKLASKFGCNVLAVRKKLKSLRSCFLREHKRLLAERNRGDNTRVQKKWFAYDMLNFLVEGNNEDQLKVNSVYESDIKDDELLFEEGEVEYDHVAQPIVSTASWDISKVIGNAQKAENIKNPTVSGQGLSKKRKINVDHSSLDTTNTTNNQTRDEFSVYGEYIANEVRKLQPTAQAVTKYHINNILFEAAIGKFNTLDLSNRSGTSSSNFNTVSTSLNANATRSSDSTADNYPLPSHLPRDIVVSPDQGDGTISKRNSSVMHHRNRNFTSHNSIQKSSTSTQQTDEILVKVEEPQIEEFEYDN